MRPAVVCQSCAFDLPRPRSMIRTTPSSPSMMFFGETSRWTASSARPDESVAECSACSPRAAWATSPHATSIGGAAATQHGRGQQLRERPPRDVLECDVQLVADGTDVVRLRDVRTVDRHGDLRLVAKPAHELVVAGAAYLAKPLDPTRGVPSPVVIKCLHMKLADDQLPLFARVKRALTRLSTSVTKGTSVSSASCRSRSRSRKGSEKRSPPSTAITILSSRPN